MRGQFLNAVNGRAKAATKATGAFALSLAAMQALPAASTAPVPELGADVEDITVTGQRLDGIDLPRFMLDFVTEIGDPVSRSHGFARWADELCVGINGIADTSTAQYVADRVSLAAMQVGLDVGEAGCRPNLHLLFVADGRAAASQLVAEYPNGFNPFYGAGGTFQGKLSLERFTSSDAPVRWWQITMVVDDMGRPAIALDGVPQVRAVNSRIQNSVSDVLLAGYVIVDISKVQDAGWEQLTDYLAMVSLAQVDPGGKPASYDSILNLFASGNPPAGMTDMDRTYLEALYRMDTRRAPHMQRGQLAYTMLGVQDREAKTANAKD